MPSPTAQSRARLTLHQQRALCAHADLVRHTKKTSNSQLETEVAVGQILESPNPRFSVANALKRHNELLATPEHQLNRKNKVSGGRKAFEGCVMTKFDAIDGQVESIMGDTVCELANAIYTQMDLPSQSRPKFSKGWLYRLQGRHGFSLKRKHGEAGSVAEDTARDGRTKMQKPTKEYARADIYNFDEMAFYFQQAIKTTYTRRKKVAGTKEAKNRITLGLAVNADGSDKLPPLYIGAAKTPRPLRGHDVWQELGVFYTHSAKSWMNSSIFLSWLFWLDNRMHAEERHILLLADNASSHVRPTLPLTNVRFEFLSKNCTTRLQPLDQGIIRATKSKYAKTKVKDSVFRFLNDLPQEKVNTFTAMSRSKQAWDNISPETI